MKVIEHGPQNHVAPSSSIVELMPWLFVVSKILEQTRIAIEGVGPVRICTAREKDDKFLVGAPTGRPEPALVPNTLKQS